MERTQAQALATAAASAPDTAKMPIRYAPSPEDLRGIPVAARGVGGASPGTTASAAIANADRDLERRAKVAWA